MAYPHQADRHHLRPTRLLSLKRASSFHTQGCLISALQRVASPVTLPCGALLPEPAITQLDWSFAPMPKSEEPIALEYPFGPPWTFRYTSSCSGIDHWVSGCILVTTGAFTPCVSLMLHTIAFASSSWLNHLNSPQKYTPRPVFLDGSCDPAPLDSLSSLLMVTSSSIYALEPQTIIAM